MLTAMASLLMADLLGFHHSYRQWTDLQGPSISAIII
uniref:Uncharacterized protein n=1 Tax=Anguilla anguilla TaxID=7936 RepID=A0A0E9RTN2_ANGAN